MALRRFVREAGIDRYRIKPIGAAALAALFTWPRSRRMRHQPAVRHAARHGFEAVPQRGGTDSAHPTSSWRGCCATSVAPHASRPEAPFGYADWLTRS